ncbi:hypothetical protein B0H63DRAFT_515470 [Podospora didyma]|uniref:Uncharacterized protein n=1 Tax=Podospora didyma TaxID=330526 RepID=A0AAE0N2E8_9PEZI|nr:hypothetical protein B0H63DRAFT_515470 [Podospora didyma]
MNQPPTHQELLNASNDEWMQALNEGPHTSFKMVEAMMAATQVSYEDFLSHPETLKARFRQNPVEPHDINPGGRYYDTWHSKTGRCTSFAIKVVFNLNSHHPDSFQFGFYNLGSHRVARCENTNILIDSKSNNGVKVQPDTVPYTFPRRNGPNIEGYWTNGNFQNSQSGQVLNRTPPHSALAACLKQTADYAVLVCAFRSIEYNANGIWVPKYRGMIRWRIASHRMELTPDMGNRHKVSCITFDRTRGNQDTHVECAEELDDFIEECGFRSQWEADGIHLFNRELWKAAIRLWGYPVWSKEELPG